jgi:sirohydrochlorin cobaltochelatase
MLILLAHGSRERRWRAPVEELTRSLQADLGHRKVRLAYMECSPPALGDVVSGAIQAGVRKIRVLPLFLTAEGHVTRDIKPLIERLRRTDERVNIELLPPVGQHPLFRDLLHKIALQAVE